MGKKKAKKTKKASQVPIIKEGSSSSSEEGIPLEEQRSTSSSSLDDYITDAGDTKDRIEADDLKDTDDDNEEQEEVEETTATTTDEEQEEEIEEEEESEVEYDDFGNKIEKVPRVICGLKCGKKKKTKKYVSLFRIYWVNPSQIPLLLLGVIGTSFY